MNSNDSNENNQYDQDLDSGLSTKEPSLYSVYLLNDDFTTQEFVIDVLVQFFFKTEEEAFKIMLDVHNKGRALVGIFTKEVAETKVFLVHQAAKENNYPLKSIMEPN
jgi:ATP-dependent Clp protease adaptor protein ClpS